MIDASFSGHDEKTSDRKGQNSGLFPTYLCSTECRQGCVRPLVPVRLGTFLGSSCEVPGPLPRERQGKGDVSGQDVGHYKARGVSPPVLCLLVRVRCVRDSATRSTTRNRVTEMHTETQRDTAAERDISAQRERQRYLRIET